MENTVMTKITKDGRTVEFLVDRFAPGQVEAYVCGAYVSSGTINKLDAPVQGCTYRVGKVGLTTAEAETLRAIIEATPAYQTALLQQERANLAAEADGLAEDAQATYWRLHSQERLDAWTRKAELETEAERAWQKLVAFDAAHPEIIVKIKAERTAAAERFARID